MVLYLQGQYYICRYSVIFSNTVILRLFASHIFYGKLLTCYLEAAVQFLHEYELFYEKTYSPLSRAFGPTS